MKVFYYTIDDMCLSRKGLLRKGWTIQHFDTLEEAIRSYRKIPLSKDKRLGLTDSMHVLELVRCVPLFSFDTAGEDMALCQSLGLWDQILPQLAHAG